MDLINPGMEETISSSDPQSQSKTSPLIVVFDSGIGGLTILDALRTRIKGARFIYACDSAGFPYGTKSEEQVKHLASEFISRLYKTYPDINLLVIACNTASTIVLPTIRQQLPIPVIGVVPAIKPAVQMTRTASFGLLATEATIRRPYTKDLLDQFARGRRVFLHGSSRLVELAEIKIRGAWKDHHTIEVGDEIAPLFKQSPVEHFKKMDTVVLGCTHFPHLIRELELTAPWPVQWIDSGQAIAARAFMLLEEAGFSMLPSPKINSDLPLVSSTNVTLRTSHSTLIWYEPAVATPAIPSVVHTWFDKS